MSTTYNPNYHALANFGRRLQQGDPAAKAALHRCVAMHQAGDAQATAALKRLASIMRQTGLSVGDAEGAQMVGAVVAPVGRVFATTGNLLETTGRLVGKPFRWLSRKLGGPAPFHFPRFHRSHPMMMSPHSHVPHRR